MIELALILTALQVWDGWSSYQIIHNGGFEMNPFMRWLMTTIGLEEALVAAKAVVVALTWFIATSGVAFADITLIALIIIYAIVGINNWQVMHR